VVAEAPGGSKLLLGSASPRRSELLAQLEVPFRVETRAIDEVAIAAGAPSALTAVTQIAQAKFVAFGKGDGAQAEILLTADTLVACAGQIMGKPLSNQDLAELLSLMSGNEIEISTAICVGERGGESACETVTTKVLLRDLEPGEIERYVACGVGMDKAGGLALQAEAGAFIHSVQGCWSNVLGLPLCAVANALGRKSGWPECCPEVCGGWKPQ